MEREAAREEDERAGERGAWCAVAEERVGGGDGGDGTGGGSDGDHAGGVLPHTATAHRKSSGRSGSISGWLGAAVKKKYRKEPVFRNPLCI